MESITRWMSPYQKQWFLVTGASLNMAQIGMVMGFGAIIIPQLRDSQSRIPVNDSTESWVAAIPGISLLVGNCVIPTILAKCGRKKANLISIALVCVGWFGTLTAQNLAWLLVARFLQGTSIGMSMCSVPVVIAEYSSPKYRGSFSLVMSCFMAVATGTVHAMGFYLDWTTTALICGCIGIVNLVILLFAPDTPIWLAEQGRYNECRKVFRYLRGDDEEDELNKMIENCKKAKVTHDLEKSHNCSSKLKHIMATIREKEFYKPIFVSLHVFALGQWAGINILAPHAADVIKNIITVDVDVSLLIISIDIQRVFSGFFAVYIISRVKRRTMLFWTIGFNIVVIFLIAGYTFAKAQGVLVYDHFLIGGVLLHLQMFTVATGSLPLPFTLAGELFPAKHRSIASGISALFCSTNIFLCVKTFTSLVKNVGISGTYLLYGTIMTYCLIVAWFLLPETKDRTLLEIEEEFTGKLSMKEIKTHELVTLRSMEEQVD